MYAVTLMAGLMCFGGRVPTMAAEESGMPADRLERLERRVNEMAERQEQFMRRLGGDMERQAAMGQPAGGLRRPQMAPVGAPPPPDQAGHGARLAKRVQDTLGLLFLIGVICNILLATWIYTDIRKRGEGSGIFVALALVAGIPAAIIYALTRIGDRKT
jgi:hypothetical protein